MTIKLPPMPESEYGLCFHDEGGIQELNSIAYTEHQMEAYAREAVRLNRAPLSDEEIDSLNFGANSPQAGGDWLARCRRFARAIEAAHGIKGD